MSNSALIKKKINITTEFLSQYEYVQCLCVGVKQLESQCEYPIEPLDTAEKTVKKLMTTNILEIQRELGNGGMIEKIPVDKDMLVSEEINKKFQLNPKYL